MRIYKFYVYITTNISKKVLYTGVTNDLSVRSLQHQANKGSGSTFAGKYYCYHVIYFEEFGDIRYAIAREKEIKGWSRAKKNALIESINPRWNFLNKDIQA